MIPFIESGDSVIASDPELFEGGAKQSIGNKDKQFIAQSYLSLHATCRISR